MMIKNKILCIVGPTATGKTDVGISLAKKLNGEIIACDSRQVYKDLDIGTGKMPGVDVPYERKDRCWIIDGVPVWGYDMVFATSQYDVSQYVSDIKEVIADVVSRGKLPIIVGGTGLYLKGLLSGFGQMGVPVDLALREELEQLSLNDIQNYLRKIDQEQFQLLNDSEKHNKRRLIRKIEIELLKDTVKENVEDGIAKDFDVLKVGLETKREVLYDRIDLRVVKRVESGMIEEADGLHRNGLTFNRMRELGLEYRMLADFLEGKIKTKAEFIEKLQFKIHQYAKRQLTWFKVDKEIVWFDILETTRESSRLSPVEEYVLDWYNIK